MKTKIFFGLMIFGCLAAGGYCFLLHAFVIRGGFDYKNVEKDWWPPGVSDPEPQISEPAQFYMPVRTEIVNYPTNFWPYAYDKVVTEGRPLVGLCETTSATSFYFLLCWMVTCIVGLIVGSRRANQAVLKIFFVVLILAALMAVVTTTAAHRRIAAYQNLTKTWTWAPIEIPSPTNGFRAPEKDAISTYPPDNWPFAYQKLLFESNQLLNRCNSVFQAAYNILLFWIATCVVGLVKTFRKSPAVKDS